MMTFIYWLIYASLRLDKSKLDIAYNSRIAKEQSKSYS